MGYTHYSYRTEQLDKATWNVAIKDIRRVLAWITTNTPVRLGDAWGKVGTKPTIGSASIKFNGVEVPTSDIDHIEIEGEQIPVPATYGTENFDGSHESVWITRVQEPSKWQTPKTNSKGENVWFLCTKTAQKPYDLAVTATFLVLAWHFGEDFQVSSDGDEGNWEPARRVCEHVLGYGSAFSCEDGFSKQTAHERLESELRRVEKLGGSQIALDTAKERLSKRSE